MSPGGRKRWRRWGLLIQLLVLAGLTVLGVFFFDLDQVRLALGQVSPPAMMGFLLLMLLTRAVTAWRWRIVARDHFGLEGLTVLFLLRIGLLAEFANLWLQSFIGGEAVRMWKVRQRTGEGKKVVGSVVLDRLVGTVGLAAACLPLLISLGVVAPTLPSLPPGSWPLIGAAALLLTVGTVVVFFTVPVARVLVKRGMAFFGDQRFPLIPLLVSLLIYPLIVLAHRIGFQELVSGSWLAVAIIALVPRLGRIVPLSLFGITAVEGSVFVVGALLNITTETLILVVAMNLLTKYVASGLGAVGELAADGRRFFREIRNSARDQGESLVPEDLE